MENLCIECKKELPDNIDGYYYECCEGLNEAIKN